MDITNQKSFRIHLATRSSILAPRAFTLIELLVVITIIGILASLIVVAAIGALKNAQRTRTKAELNQIANAVDDSKTKATAYPPNCQTDDNKFSSNSNPLDDVSVFNDLKRYMRIAFPRNQESDELLLAILGQTQKLDQSSADNNYRPRLNGGITAGEAVVFWLGPFSADPKYPISGDGGPSYTIPSRASGPGSTNRTLDPVDKAKGGSFPFDVTRLAPRDSSGYFDDSTSRYVEYPDPRNSSQLRRINFWQYVPAKSDQPYLYFDTSRHPVGIATGSGSGSKLNGAYDPPAATVTSRIGPNGVGLDVYAFKKVSETSTGPAIQFINPDKFQVIHCGLSTAWDEENFRRMAPEKLLGAALRSNNPNDYLLLPTGPFIGDIAEAIVNFTDGTKIEDAQK